MNKTELIAAVAEKTGLSKKDTEAVIAATLRHHHRRPARRRRRCSSWASAPSR